MKCPACGSRSLLEQKHSVFCHKCGVETITVQRSILDDVDNNGQIVQTPSKSKWKDPYWLAFVLICILLGILVEFLVTEAFT